MSGIQMLNKQEAYLEFLDMSHVFGWVQSVCDELIQSDIALGYSLLIISSIVRATTITIMINPFITIYYFWILPGVNKDIK